MGFFLRPAGGRLEPLADSGSVLPVGECHEVYGDRVGKARQNFLRRKRQMANLVRAAVSQEMGDKQRQSANWEECKGSIATLQEDLLEMRHAQMKIGSEIATFVTELQQATEGLAEVRAHMLGQFWTSMQGMRGAGGMPLATTGAAPNPTQSDVASDVEGLCGVLTRVELLEEARDMLEDGMSTEAARRGELSANVDRLRGELEALQRDGVQGQLHTAGSIQGSIRAAIREGALSDAVDTMKEVVRQEISPVLKRVQGVEVHAHTSAVKFDQRLAILESDIVKDGGLDLVRNGLAKVQQKTATIWQTVQGSEVTKGEEAVLYGFDGAVQP
jgi:hypothetical protein